MRSQTPSLATVTCIGDSSLCARSSANWPGQANMLNSLVWSATRISAHTAEFATTAHRRAGPALAAGVPPPQRSGGNVFLLLRHTGMRIGECADLSFDCLRSIGPDQWTIHVPLGKLKPNAWSHRCCSVYPRPTASILPFPRSAASRRSAAGPSGSKVALVVQLRDYLHLVCHALASPQASSRTNSDILRTEMLRSGVSFPVLMKLLGHKIRHDHALCRCGLDRSPA